MIKTLTTQEAVEGLRSHGLKISPERLRLGLEQRVYPFGVVVVMESGQRVPEIYSVLLDQWIAERSDKGCES